MRQAEADVCLLLEGTYPYVTGGVSSWVHQIITRMPELRFAVQYIGASREPRLEMRYTLPANVVAFESMYLFDEPLPAAPARLPDAERARLYGALAAMHQAMRAGEVDGPFGAVLAGLSGGGAGSGARCPMNPMKNAPNLRNLLADREAWDLLTRLYDERAPGESFIDYFWTFRFMHLPIWQVMAASRRVPAARVYHSVSTGYAGLLGAVLRTQRARPLLLTEHGIYTKERKIEIAQAQWIHAARQQGFVAFQGLGYLKELWTRCFGFMGRAAYEAADAITTLYDGNRRMQIEHGAPPEKIQVIPNGIDVKELGRLAAPRAPAARPTVGFVGRLVPIKDVKTLIRATKIAAAAVEDIEVLIAGPTDEDPAYTRECADLVSSLELGGHVRFLGKQDVARVYPRIDVLALSSISEALPLVILEAQAAGLPVVATDVGACRELLEGRGPEDRALGPSGLLTAIADPQEMASALVRLLRDPALRARLAAAGAARVGRYYRQSDIIERYRALYRQHIEADPAAVAAAGAAGAGS